MKDNEHLGFYKHDRLPHFDKSGCFQFLTFVLADAAPAQRQPQNSHMGRIGGDWLFLQMDSQLDRCRGECLLARKQSATELLEVLRETANSHFDLLAWVIMPNHFHLLIRQHENARLGDSVRLIKARSATRINRTLNRSGKLWQAGYFDRSMRSLEHIKSTIDYIHDNPVKAGLVASQLEWAHSSVHEFTLQGLMNVVDLRGVLTR